MSHKKVDEVLVGADVMSATLAALRGASPGASTAVQATIEVI
jgi:L-2-hydroxyglutarate oxidase LhgO